MRRRTNYRFGIRPPIFSPTVQWGRNRLPGSNGETFAGRGLTVASVAGFNETDAVDSRAVCVTRAKRLVLDPAYPSRETLERVAGLLAQWLNDHAA